MLGTILSDGKDAMLPVEINTPIWRHSQLNLEENEVGLRSVASLIDEMRDVTHVMEFFAKQRETIR